MNELEIERAFNYNEKTAKKVKEILKNTRTALAHFPNHSSADKQAAVQWLEQAQTRQNELEWLHQNLRSQHPVRLGQGSTESAVSIAAFADILNHFEHMADCALHITQEALCCKPASQQHSSLPAPAPAQ